MVLPERKRRMKSEARYVRRIESMGASHAAYLPAGEIPFDASFRDACVQNACGYYNRCWTCPPDCGEVGELIAKVKSFRHAVAYQTIWPLEDSYDIEGMHEAAVGHNRLTVKVQDEWRGLEARSMVLGAGACGVCAACTKPDGLPCRFPERAVTSIEACGIDASALAKRCGLNYINGRNTVTYFGILLYGGSR